ncbi:Glycosyltransferase [Minicystis rosea]|nr:Glycosyltransferase [Minicystis rosea]
MKVAHVTPSYHPAYVYGGPPESAHQLSRHLAQGGCEVRVLTTNANGPKLTVDVDTTRAIEMEPGLRVRYCPRRLPDSVAPSLLALLPEHVAWCDVVHLNAVYNFTTFPALIAAKAANKPVVWSARGALSRWKETRRAGAKEVWEHACRLLAPRRTVLHVTSESEETQAAARMKGMRTALIPNGVEVPREAPRPAPSETLRILYLGRLHPIKGLDNLVAACGALLRRGERRFSLTLAGSGDPAYEETLRRAVREHAAEAHVTFLGEAKPSAKGGLFANADLFVMPSFTENFGLAIAEALAHGVPVIAGKGTPWSGLESNDVGRWTPNDPESLADAIVSMRTRPLVEMGARGRAWMEREFGWGRVATDMRALYDRLVAEGR